MRQRGKHGGHSGIYQGLQTLGIHLVDIADESEVDTVLKRTLVRAYHVHVGTGQSDGVDTKRLQLSHDVLVNQSTVNHCHHLKHFGIGDASSAHHLALYAELCSHLRGATASSMYQNLVSLNLLETLKKSGKLCRILHNGAANLNYCDFHKRKIFTGYKIKQLVCANNCYQHAPKGQKFLAQGNALGRLQFMN